MFRRLLIPLALAAAALAIAPAALAGGGNYVFEGGNAAQQKTVVSALSASSFPWDVVPAPIVVHIERGTASRALPGHVWLDADLLDSGRFSWGVVQHEYAHQVDFLVLTEAMRAQLHLSLQGSGWWTGGSHDALDCERFADLVAWSFWESPDNVMKPAGAQDAGGQMTPAAFRAELATLLPATATATATVAAKPVSASGTRTTASVAKSRAKKKR
jgi:hypothetical protein